MQILQDDDKCDHAGFEHQNANADFALRVMSEPNVRRIFEELCNVFALRFIRERNAPCVG